ncbi:D-glycerate dehydrogenase [Ferruginibacter sp. HRS2-29]|uniref:2-hydroxyacid dehydrogenase n=1 Tax=Ferruginibacter sp. HRS2-29 TaxID=2487334 RepID=UPI0020CDB9C9|nr:D-glycerate dehydrogenase [Ferruginibacter sp. HRS2-29]MCP9750625.1 D-glycerate dehydrogenase [Ferruginibacter sp. HRS2-29]
MNIFLTRKIPQAGLQLLEQSGHTITIWEEKRDLLPSELIDFCLKNDALLSAGPSKIDAAFLEACKHLKVIALHSVGFDQVDIAAATALRIPIGNTPGVLSDATADTAFLLMLATSRKAFSEHKRILEGNWGFFEPTAGLGIEIKGKTLGVFGLGSIGFEMARKCVGAYGMKVIYHNRGNNLKAEQELGAVKVSFDELLAQSDILTVHTALTPETKGLFDIGVFKKMKPGSIFINTARGAIHNEADLIQALEQKLIWGAGLDVTNPEPMDPSNVLLSMPNVAVLPHIGSATVETRNAMSVIAARNILAGLAGERLPFVVNEEIYANLKLEVKN